MTYLVDDLKLKNFGGQMKNKKPDETLNEFLARGGKITIVPPKTLSKLPMVSSTIGGPINILSLDDASIIFGEPDKKTKTIKKSKSKPTIDINLLPEHIRAKYIDKFLEEMGNE